MKRTLDVLVSTIGLVAVSPLLLALIVGIRLSSPGAALYRGVRVGKHGKPFFIYKLRTMVVNADQLGGSETPDDDPRITSFGALLRRYKLDELPQLFNVLKGDMSLVGPRPEVMDEVACYTTEERALLQVRPGLTDWASVKYCHEGALLRGCRDPHTTYHELIRPDKTKLGLEYVHHHGFLVDCKIIFQTVKVLFQ